MPENYLSQWRERFKNSDCPRVEAHLNNIKLLSMAMTVIDVARGDSVAGALLQGYVQSYVSSESPQDSFGGLVRLRASMLDGDVVAHIKALQKKDQETRG